MYRNGMDKSKLASDTVTDESEHVELIEVYYVIQAGLDKKGFRLIANVGGEFSNHDVYINRPLNAYPAIKVWRKVSTHEEKKSFYAALNAVVSKNSGNGSEWLKVAHKIKGCLVENLGQSHNALCGIGRMLGNQRELEFYRSHTGNPVAFKQVPQVEWFPELADLHPHEIISLLPPAEADMLMLILGRAIVGASKAKCLEGSVTHYARSAAILVGDEAGLGKSTLLKGVVDAARALGFQTKTVGDIKGRFGGAEIASSDISFKDDLNNDAQTKILGSDVMKTIISGGELATEQKGKDGVDTLATTVFIACSNNYSIRDFYKMDSGSVSRFNFLYTYTRSELEEIYPDHDGRIVDNMVRLCEKYKTTESAIYTYLLARCARYFLECVGYEVLEGQLLQTSEDKLEVINKGLRSKLYLDPDMKHVNLIMTSVAQLVAMSMYRMEGKRAKIAKEKLRTMDFSGDLLYAMLTAACVKDKEFRDTGLGDGCLSTIKTRLKELDNVDGRYSYAKHLQQITSEMIAANGATYPSTHGFYVEKWNTVKKKIPAMCERYSKLHETRDEDDERLFCFDNLVPALKTAVVYVDTLLTNPE